MVSIICLTIIKVSHSRNKDLRFPNVFSCIYLLTIQFFIKSIFEITHFLEMDIEHTTARL